MRCGSAAQSREERNGRVKQAHGELIIQCRGKGFHDITPEIRRWVSKQEISIGLLTVFIQHTSASLTIQENADPDVLSDLSEFFERLVPENAPWFRHTTEGPDDMPAHIRSVLTSPSLSIPVLDGAPALGTWQAIYLFEHRSIHHRRHVLLHVLGTPTAKDGTTLDFLHATYDLRIVDQVRIAVLTEAVES